MLGKPAATVRGLLTEPQERALASGVRRLRETLDELERLLTGDTGAALDIAPGHATELRGAVVEIRDRLTALSRLLGVEVRPLSARRAFVALASSAWTVAEDLHPAKLTRYGAVHPEAARLLAPHVEAIAAGFLRLAKRGERLNGAPTVGDSPPRSGNEGAEEA
ncbi:MAG: hypothetical protein C4290_03850 [Chloroflexota bacterium]